MGDVLLVSDEWFKGSSDCIYLRPRKDMRGALFGGSSPLLTLLSFAENHKGSSIRGVSRPQQILNAAHRDCQDLAID
jgi:hypothetical protein